MKKNLNFSNQFFRCEYIETENKLEIAGYGIVLNLGKDPIELKDSSEIIPYKSYLLKDLTLETTIEKAVVTYFDFDPVKDNIELNKFCSENWDNNKIRYPDDPSKWNYPILRSPIEKVGNMEFNSWYLPENTASSIHNEHSFKEVHTQIYGLGIMNKFKEQDYDSLYQRMYMPPGFTHDFFFDKNVKYPWHQYEAVSSSIWMAVMEN